MGRAKAKFNANVFESFFIEGPMAFTVTKGLPIDAKLVDIVFDPRTKEGVAVFESPQFAEVPSGKEHPFKAIEYQAYEMVTPAADAVDIEDVVGKLNS